MNHLAKRHKNRGRPLDRRTFLGETTNHMTLRRFSFLPVLAGLMTLLSTSAWAHPGHLGAEVPGTMHSHAMTGWDVLLVALLLGTLATGAWFVSRRKTARDRVAVRRRHDLPRQR